jgi:hypothetical protein
VRGIRSPTATFAAVLILTLQILQLQAPAWNAISLEYKDEEKVVFGDVNLSKGGVRTGPGEYRSLWIIGHQSLDHQ